MVVSRDFGTGIIRLTRTVPNQRLAAVRTICSAGSHLPPAVLLELFDILGLDPREGRESSPVTPDVLSCVETDERRPGDELESTGSGGC